MWRSGRAYSQDRRDRVLRAMDAGSKVGDFAAVPGQRLVHLQGRGATPATGETEARPQRNHQELKLAGPITTRSRPRWRAGRMSRWRSCGPGCWRRIGSSASLGLMHKTLARLGLTLKKSRAGRRSRTGPTSPSGAPNGAAGQRWLNPARLVFVDETGAATNMARRYGRSPRGQRLDGPVPHGHWKSTTFVGGLTSRGFIAPYVLDGADERRHLQGLGRADAGARSCGRATSSSWTISPPTRSPASARRSRPAAPSCVTCRPTRPTSTRSSRPSPSSRPSCASGRAHGRRPVERHRPAARPVPTGRVRQLHRQLRLSTVNMKTR